MEIRNRIFINIRKFLENNEYRCILYTQIKPRNRHKYDSSNEKAESVGDTEK